MGSHVRLALVAGAFALVAAQAEGATMDKPIVGMYVHQHWSYNHPYAARTWTFEDWHGYVDGLKRLGYNTVMIWPVLETMPNPLTPSDRACIEKIAKVIHVLHNEFAMKAYIVIAPNVAAKNDEAAKYTFEQRPFFYSDYRVNPGDSAALTAMMNWREELLRPLAETDGLVIIDSDPGGYPGSTDAEFINLLAAHRAALDRIRPGIELVYWNHVGWEAYCRYYATAQLVMGTDAAVTITIRSLATRSLEPWGLTGGRLDAINAMGQGARMFSFPYGAIEGEPSFPLTNFGGRTAYDTGKTPGPRGIMGNAQTHCVQLPYTFAFARGAQGLPCAEPDYVRFADDLLPGHGATIVAAWKALVSADQAQLAAALSEVQALATGPLSPGPLKGLLFGSPQRFIDDLVLQMHMQLALERFHQAAFASPSVQSNTVARLGEFAAAAGAWQAKHAYRNNWSSPRMEEALRKFNDSTINAALSAHDYLGEGKTPFERVQSGFYKVETYTPRLLDAMRSASQTVK